MSRRGAGDAAPPGSTGGVAIRRHLEAADGGTVEWCKPRPPRSYSGGGPIEVVAAARVASPEHWHLVTCGLSEMHGKGSPGRRLPDWGLELTFRVAAKDDGVPGWAADLLTSLAAYLRSVRQPFAEGHLMDLRGPIRIGSSTPITAALTTGDPVLGTLDGPFGPVQFLQVVGLTADELELCRAWSADGVRELLARDDPFLVTVLDRVSLTDDPRYRDEIQERSWREGSALHELRIATLRVRRRRRGRVDVQMGSGAAAALGPALRRELIAEGAAFSVVGEDAELRFIVGGEAAWRVTDDGVEAVVAADGVEYVAALFDGRTGPGRASDWPGLRFRVVP